MYTSRPNSYLMACHPLFCLLIQFKPKRGMFTYLKKRFYLLYIFHKDVETARYKLFKLQAQTAVDDYDYLTWGKLNAIL